MQAALTQFKALETLVIIFAGIKLLETEDFLKIKTVK